MEEREKNFGRIFFLINFIDREFKLNMTQYEHRTSDEYNQKVRNKS